MLRSACCADVPTNTCPHMKNDLIENTWNPRKLLHEYFNMLLVKTIMCSDRLGVKLGTTGSRGWTTAMCSSGEGHKTRCRKPFDSSTRRVTYPESYITKYTTYTKINSLCNSQELYQYLELSASSLLLSSLELSDTTIFEP